MAKMKPTLEDYIFDMETRPPDHGTPNDQDLWAQLQKKESDLLLAAELGKALLEKNEELAKQQEKIIEEYSKKLEVSEPILLFSSVCSFTAQCFSANRRNFIDEIVKHRPIKIQSFFEFYAFIRLVQFTITPSRWEFFLSKSSVWPHNSRNVFHLAKPLEFSRRISSFMIAMTEHSSREKRKKTSFT